MSQENDIQLLFDQLLTQVTTPKKRKTKSTTLLQNSEAAIESLFKNIKIKKNYEKVDLKIGDIVGTKTIIGFHDTKAYVVIYACICGEINKDTKYNIKNRGCRKCNSIIDLKNKKLLFEGTIQGKRTIKEIYRHTNGKLVAICVCKCNELKHIELARLKEGESLSCPKCKKMTIKQCSVKIGDVFGTRTVIEAAQYIHGKYHVLTQCICGRKDIVDIHSLKRTKFCVVCSAKATNLRLMSEKKWKQPIPKKKKITQETTFEILPDEDRSLEDIFQAMTNIDDTHQVLNKSDSHKKLESHIDILQNLDNDNVSDVFDAILGLDSNQHVDSNQRIDSKKIKKKEIIIKKDHNIGLRFGKRTVTGFARKYQSGIKLYTNICDCGKIQTSTISYIKKNKECRWCITDMDIIGRKYNKWTIEKFAGNHGTRGKMFICTCDCGNISTISWSSMKSNKSTQCVRCRIIQTQKMLIAKPRKQGYYEQIQNGTVFGNRTIIDSIIKINKLGQGTVLCKCICGQEKAIPYQSLLEGRATSCHKCAQQSRRQSESLINKSKE